MAWPRRPGFVEEEECGLSTAPVMAIGVWLRAMPVFASPGASGWSC